MGRDSLMFSSLIWGSQDQWLLPWYFWWGVALHIERGQHFRGWGEQSRLPVSTHLLQDTLPTKCSWGEYTSSCRKGSPGVLAEGRPYSAKPVFGCESCGAPLSGHLESLLGSCWPHVISDIIWLLTLVTLPFEYNYQAQRSPFVRRTWSATQGLCWH